MNPFSRHPIALPRRAPKVQPDWLTEHLQAKERRRAAVLARLWAWGLSTPSRRRWPVDWLSVALYALLMVILGVLLTIAYTR